MPTRAGSKKVAKAKSAETYKHPESTNLMRPEVGTQAQFKKKKQPEKYTYDDSLAPSLEWDGQNPARERGEERLARMEQELAEAQKALTEAQQPAAAALQESLKQATERLRSAQEALRELKALSK